jgi:hypothetical protein
VVLVAGARRELVAAVELRVTHTAMTYARRRQGLMSASSLVLTALTGFKPLPGQPIATPSGGIRPGRIR